MIVIRNMIKREDGSYDMTWTLSVEQMEFLITYAINSLLAEGLVEVVDEEQTPEKVKETKEEIQRQLNIDFLEDLDENDLPQA